MSSVLCENDCVVGKLFVLFYLGFFLVLSFISLEIIKTDFFYKKKFIYTYIRIK